MFDDIVGQAQAKETLAGMLASSAIPHALLFAGPYGAGKGEMALALAARLLCEGGLTAECDSCGGCRRARKLEHPDLHLLFPFRAQPQSAEAREKWIDDLIAHRQRLRDEPYAPVVYEQAREIVRGLTNEVRERLLQSSFEGGRRVCIILLAERMNASTANSILKILEEPPADVHFILTAQSLSSVLPTITSRCTVVPFRRLRPDEIAEYLSASGKLERAQVVSYSQAAGGSLKTAKALAFERKADILAASHELFERVARGSEDAVINAALEFLPSRDTAGAEELLNGFIQCAAAILDEKYSISGMYTLSDSPVAALSAHARLDALEKLARQFEAGLEMLGRNVGIPTVMTSTLYGIHETFDHARTE
ncbi:ATP-binding protein [Candidatus Latescibacterota bacterium]